MAGRSYKTEAVVLRSFRFGEADRVLHLYTLDRGRVGAVAKGIRKTKSRFGARLEPLSHVELMLHQGSGELQTVTGVELLGSHHAAREHPYRLGVGLLGAEAMLRLFTEQEANARAFQALTRFLDLLDELEPDAARPSLDGFALSFQLKLLWLSGYLPHLTS
jgi:DNA repair protein RecO (recombination protein O)